MKICENCRMEYGDDNSFCPYCDERYGVVISENDVISADFPKYSEEFPPIGEICVNEKSFTANRNEIYKRNMLLSVMEENIPEQNEAVEPQSAGGQAFCIFSGMCIFQLLFESLQTMAVGGFVKQLPAVPFIEFVPCGLQFLFLKVQSDD